MTKQMHIIKDNSLKVQPSKVQFIQKSNFESNQVKMFKNRDRQDKQSPG